MTDALLERHRVALRSGEIAFADVGNGPPALFLHGVVVNADLWARAIAALQHERRCIAPDLPAHGQTSAHDDADLSLFGLASLVDELLDALGVDQVDIVASDTGGALAQMYAATRPDRIASLVLTNCDVHDNLPPVRFREAKALAERGEFAPLMLAMVDDHALARSAVGFGQGYEHPARLSDERLRSYLEPHRRDGGRGLERFMTSMSSAELVAVEPRLRELEVPTLIVWGTGDLFFEPHWAERLREMIPGVEEVVYLQDARLFFPDERSHELVPHISRLWARHARVAV